MDRQIRIRYTQATVSAEDTRPGDEISVKVEDEGAGPYLVLSGRDWGDGGLSIDLDELEAILSAAKDMVEQHGG